MPDIVTDAHSKQANQTVGKPGLMTGKSKWLVIGGLAIVAILVFFFVKQSNANSGSGNSTSSTALDPSTQAALQNALQAQGAAYNSGSVQGPAGPAGPTGQAGPAGPPGKQGPPGKSGGGKHHKHGKNHDPKDATEGGSQFVSSVLAAIPGSYTVKAGDTLGSIAALTGNPPHAIWSVNRMHLGNNPNSLVPGMRLQIP